VRLEDAEPRFERMIWERSERIMRRGIDSGRFRVDDGTLALTIAIAGVLATIRARVDGRVGEDAGTACAAALLRAVGIPNGEAVRIARKELSWTPS
ncbi:MAG TPA: hypothetical protein VFZ89_07680, partial [Solirubrobacteraceae bacterium]